MDPAANSAISNPLNKRIDSDNPLLIYPTGYNISLQEGFVNRVNERKRSLSCKM